MTNNIRTNISLAANVVFFLGGADAEMRRIAAVLKEDGVPFHDAGLGWGAKASAYADAIADAAEAGLQPVLVELEIDIDLPEGAIIIDHHGDRSGEPASLLQVLEFLGLEPSRWDEVVAANDSGWYPGLIAVNATPAEMTAVRMGEALAQGIDLAKAAEIERALSAPEEFIGPVRVVRMSHSKTGLVGDILAITAIAAGATSPTEFPAYIVFSDDGEVNFSGDGATAAALHAAFPGGWAGGSGLGSADGSAYWGGYPSHDAVLAFLANRFAKAA